jgi:hypothetical protein
MGCVGTGGWAMVDEGPCACPGGDAASPPGQAQGPCPYAPRKTYPCKYPEVEKRAFQLEVHSYRGDPCGRPGEVND